MTKVVKILGLCAGRHELPAHVQGFVFEQITDPTDLDGMMSTCAHSIGYCTELVVYVTGLTVALVTVINYCREEGIILTLMHYDRESGKYYPQQVVL